MTPQFPSPQTSRAYFFILTVIHLALLSGQILFGIVAYYIVTTSDLSSNSREINQILMVIVPIMAMGGIIGSSFLAKTQLNMLKQKELFSKKLTAYQTTLIIKFALLEGTSLISIVSYLLTGNALYMGIAAAIILIFIINRPTRTKTITDLEVGQKEREILENPDAVIED